jgi:putative membrane protein
MKREAFLRRFHWKILLLRILINAIVLAITVLVTPRIRFVDPSLLSILFRTVVLGVLNALVKPFLQFLLLPLIFASYGLVIVLVNTLMLLLLAFLFPGLIVVEKLLWAFAAGALIGILGTLLENLFGLIPPIVPDEETGLRKRFFAQPVSSLGGAFIVPPLLEEEQLAIEAPEDERQPTELEPDIGTPADVVEAVTSAPASPPGEGPETIIKEEGER